MPQNSCWSAWRGPTDQKRAMRKLLHYLDPRMSVRLPREAENAVTAKMSAFTMAITCAPPHAPTRSTGGAGVAFDGVLWPPGDS